ncbi:hypothetical protein LY76DRAFT_402113 [Colletotrichum caudatum]|nr:hypothetical protein LY76DRAFT_402113 [Colletotrichum caudatum]
MSRLAFSCPMGHGREFDSTILLGQVLLFFSSFFFLSNFWQSVNAPTWSGTHTIGLVAASSKDGGGWFFPRDDDIIALGGKEVEPGARTHAHTYNGGYTGNIHRGSSDDR